MLKRTLAVLAGILFSASVFALDADDLRPDHPDSYTVVEGRPMLTSGRVLGQRPQNEKLSPRMRDMGGKRAVGPIPLDELEAFLEHTRVLSEADADALPYVVGNEETRLRTTEMGLVYAAA